MGSGQIDANAVGTTKVIAESVTPIYAAITTGAVSWVAETTVKDMQTVSGVVVTRGKVFIRASLNCDLESFTAVGTIGILRLWRGTTEVFAAEDYNYYQGQIGTKYLFARRWFMDWIDEPAPGTYTYKITFDPGHAASGDVRRRFLSCSPLHG